MFVVNGGGGGCNLGLPAAKGIILANSWIEAFAADGLMVDLEFCIRIQRIRSFSRSWLRTLMSLSGSPFGEAVGLGRLS